MALVTLPSPMVWPGLTEWVTNNLAVGTVTTMDAAGEYDAVVIVAREAMTISHVGFRDTTATGSPTVDIRIETVGTDGLPTGTLWAANTNIVTGALTANTFALFALTAPATIAAGQVFCVKIIYNSGTTATIAGISTGMAIKGGLPYQVVNTGAAAKANLAIPRSLALGSSATTFYQVRGLLPVNSVGVNAFNNTSSAKRGLRFIPPFKCRCIGIRHHMSSALGDINAILMSDAGAELSSSSTAYDGDHGSAASTSTMDYPFDNPVTLVPGTAYRAVIEPSSATNTNISTAVLPSLNYRSAWPGGTACLYTTFAGSWVDTATDTLPLTDILIDQIDDGFGNTKMLVNSGELTG